ncbi:MAG: hypothetical protein P4L49_07480 [Desulfosporosinus sp.]|nr:hypothetical protein [Desulfosporosinus sp.]
MDNISDGKTIKNIIHNYVQNEKTLVDQLYFKTSHGITIGGFREDIWRGMFEQIVPKKFVIEQSVFIIDSEGRVSNEVDLAIFDETYTPYIFRYGRLKFLPIEAVTVAIECKSTSLNQKNLKTWTENIVVLTTSRESYTRMFGSLAIGEKNPNSTQTATRPLRILCCLNEGIINENLSSGDKLFDFVIRASEESKNLTIEVDNSKGSLQAWYCALNHADEKQRSESIKDGSELENIKLEEYQVNQHGKPVSLLTFNLQLNQLLMLINNPILFPHKKYASMFDKFS